MDELLIAFDILTGTPVALVALIGMTWGIFGGALPGISPSITMALLLPFTYTMEPIPALVLLASTYVGAEYGGSIPAILIRTPGTNAAAATLIEGYEMTRQGRAGDALGISLLASFTGTLFGISFLILLTEPLTELALAFRPASYFGLGVLGLSVIAMVSEGSLTKGVIAALLGLMIATVGTDPVSGVPRFTYGVPALLTGIPLILVMVGLYAVSELLEQASLPNWEKVSQRGTRLKLPSLRLQRRLARPAALGVSIGAFCGVMPGAGGTVASFMAYNEAKRFSRRPDEFGKGSPEGVAATESANNCDAGVALVPLLSFGIPASNSAAIMLGGFLIQGLVPGPVLFERDPTLLYGLYTGLVVAAFGLLLVALLTLPLCLWLVNRPKPYLMAFILALVFSGAYSINYSLFDLMLVLTAGVIGFGMRFFGLPLLPTVLGLVLGFLIESNYRRALVISDGDHSIFIRDTFSAIFLALAVLFLAGSLYREFRGRRKTKTEASA